MTSCKARIIGTFILLALMLFALAGAKAEEKVVSRGEVGATIAMLRQAKLREGCKNPVIGAYSKEKGRGDIVVVADCKDDAKATRAESRKEQKDAR